MSADTGFIGLGHLGRAMAGRLIGQGTKLIVWNRTASRADGLRAEKAKSPADLANRCGIIFLNLCDSDAVREVFTSPEGHLSGDCRDKVIVDTTTNHFEAVPGFYGLAAQAGPIYLGAPVLGSVVPASQGELTILVGGNEIAFGRVRSLLDKLAKNIFYFPTPMAATRMKLVNNMVLGSFMATIAEALVLGETCGLERTKVLDILAAGAGNSAVLNAKRQKLIDEDYAPHFSAAAISKDLTYARDLSRSLNRPFLMAGMAREVYSLVQRRGDDTRDLSIVFEILQGLRVKT
ncbi:MAG: NAD(P)-dependent oxidoreductase [candidate division Zixibacteria bacterium]|nr:NAD(P)-dependent oxidoreductase [candidate division Zixibacteria bacterium]